MKKNPGTLLLFFIGIVFLIFIFRQWVLSNEIIGGDWPYFFNETLKEFSLFPPAWSSTHGNGLGGTILTYYIDQYLYFTAYLSTSILHIPWVIGYKLFWFGFFIVLSISSIAYLLKTIFPKIKLWQMGIAAIIFTANTYILMVVGGGQMGVALSYSIAPLVLASFMRLIDNLASAQLNFKFPLLGGQAISNFKFSIVAGLVLAVQVMFDPRIAYLTVIAVMGYCLINKKFQIVSILYTFIIPIGIAVLLHSYWILPLLITRTLSIPEGFVSVSGFGFFSFADFSHAISLLHPNWPENIFGKTYFLQPEFLLLPILAYVSLLFVSKTKDLRLKTYIIYFALLGLIGAFLAKGANPPFGEINQWLFQYIPGMNMFRDPTKFYLLVALAYSVLIPFTIYSIFDWFNSKFKSKNAKIQFKIQNYSQIAIFLFFISYWVILIHPAIFGQLNGTFKRYEVPKEYVELKDFLYKQPEFFRTLWVPRQQRFTFASNTHPSIEATPLFKATSSAQIVSGLKDPESQRLLEELSVKYVIIPYDSMGEIFIKDRKYDKRQYEDAIKEIGKITWLKSLDGFGKVAVFEVDVPGKNFRLGKEEGSIDNKIISSMEKYYAYGRWVSLMTLLSVVISLILLKIKKI